MVAALRALYRRLRGTHDPWRHFVTHLSRAALEHTPDMRAHDKRALFKRNITLVELEPHAYCNRTCSFCPNATIDRLTVKTRLDVDLYEAVLADLASIEYDRVLRFARYSEPLSDAHIYDMIARARRRLPKAELDIVTNGDYLNLRALTRLRDAGLSVLRISVYMRRGVAWTVDGARQEIRHLGRRLEIEPTWTDGTATTVGARFPFERLPIVAFSHNFDEIGYDRGKLVERLVDARYVRRSPCFLVFSNFTVDFNGKVMPCCNLRSDHPDHERFVMGDLSGGRQSIFDVYAGGIATAWRQSLVRVGDKAAPCTTCKQKALEGEPLDRFGRAVDRKLRRLGIDVERAT
jgi:radical SAM family protein/iron-sulfur cluster protein